MRKVLILDPRDNIAVCLADLAEGDVIMQDDITITVKNRIPRGHKIATAEIAKNDGIIKYGERMGHAIAPIAVGEHVHVHNILGDRLSAEQV
jgi:altronate dehydratase small subunit